MKTVLITGANRGVGQGFCRHYLLQGWRVIAATRNGLDVEFIKGFSEPQRKSLLEVKIELEDENSIKKAAQEVAKVCPNIDLLLNNAGVSINQSLGYWTQDALLKSYQINAVAPALLIQALEYQFNEGSKIIQLTSGLASIENNINPLGPFDAYSMSKVAVNMLTRRIAKQFESQKIVVCALSPGWVQTDMGGAEATASVEEAVAQLTSTIEQLKIEQSGGFFDEQGQPISW
ncbi:MAG: SDR family oxidoreductase [Thalassotalea sp.]